MGDDAKGRHIRHADLAPFGRRFDPEAYDLRVLAGDEVGLRTTVMHATIAPGNGPRRHRHPHADIITLHGGTARFEVDGEGFDATAGDMVVIPAGAWHGFVTTGNEPLRNTAVHENPRPVTEWEDGERQD